MGCIILLGKILFRFFKGKSCCRHLTTEYKPKAFKAVQKKVQKDTESVCMNLEFIDSEANRELAVGYGYLTKADLNYAMSHLENNNNEFCSYSSMLFLLRRILL